MGYRHNQRGGPRFIDLPRNRRADMVFKLKHQIARGPYRNFTSHDYLTDGVSWCDIYFIGSDRFTLWNATIVTASDDYKGARWSAAYDAVLAQMTSEHREEHLTRNHFSKDEFVTDPSLPKGFRLWRPRIVTYDQFDGRTFNEQINHIENTIEVSVFEKIKIDPSYRYGIGLEATLDIALITPDVLSDFVDRFIEGGEQPFISTTPAQLTQEPTFLSNAIVLDD